MCIETACFEHINMHDPARLVTTTMHIEYFFRFSTKNNCFFGGLRFGRKIFYLIVRNYNRSCKGSEETEIEQAESNT